VTLKAAMPFLAKRTIVIAEAIEHNTAAQACKGSKQTAEEMLEVLPHEYLRLSLLRRCGTFLKCWAAPPHHPFPLVLSFSCANITKR